MLFSHTSDAHSELHVELSPCLPATRAQHAVNDLSRKYTQNYMSIGLILPSVAGLSGVSCCGKQLLAPTSPSRSAVGVAAPRRLRATLPSLSACAAPGYPKSTERLASPEALPPRSKECLASVGASLAQASPRGALIGLFALAGPCTPTKLLEGEPTQLEASSVPLPPSAVGSSRLRRDHALSGTSTLRRPPARGWHPTV